MPSWMLLLTVALPFVGGVALYFLGKFLPIPGRLVLAWSTVGLTTVLTLLMVIYGVDAPLALFSFAPGLDVVLRLDSMGRCFAALVAVLWPLTTCYAKGYMTHQHHRTLFYSFFLMAYGATLGVAFSGSFVTLYCFYELLTLTTLPLVMHALTPEAIRAGLKYLALSIGGAAFALVGMISLHVQGVSLNFQAGGWVSAGAENATLLRLAYFTMYMGFGVKAAIFPFHGWLPSAAVAPTPVTALLHAVAVVKSGAFAILRLTYFCFGTAILAGSWVQSAAMGMALLTILFGSAMALKQSHWKRRLAYSTVSNLSYLLFGITLMTPEGMTAAMLHMIFHALTKILAFFAAGNVLHMTGREYQPQLNGLARKMPVTFACFAVSALSLTGVPGLCVFVSKTALIRSAFGLTQPLAWAGAVVIVISALLTAIYMLSTVVRAYFPNRDETLQLEGVKEAEATMWVPMVLIAAAIVVLGLWAGPVAAAAQSVAALCF